MRSAALFLLTAWTISAHAICFEESADDRLRHAEVVALVVITEAKLIKPPEGLRDKRPFRVEYAFERVDNLKGDGESLGTLYSHRRFHDPHQRRWSIAEEAVWQVGDVVLVVTKTPDDVNIGFCGDYVDHDARLLQRIAKELRNPTPAR